MTQRHTRYYAHRLPQIVRDYLTLVAQRGTTTPIGVFEPRPRSYDQAKNHLPVWMLIAGIVGLLALAAYHNPVFDSVGALQSFRSVSEPSRWIAAAFAAAALAGMALFVRSWRLRRRFPFPTPFAYIDGVHYWNVGRTFVDAYTLSDSTGLGWLQPVLKVFAPAGEPVDIRLGNTQLIQITAAFLQRMQHLRGTGVAATASAVQAWSSLCVDPAAAVRALETFRIPDRLPDGTETVGRAAEPIAQLKIGGAAAALGGVLAAAAVPWALEAMQHATMLRTARASTAGLLGPRAYLAHYPTNEHVAEIAALLDNRWFEQALADTKAGRSPTPLEAYLADDRNRINRARAEEQLDELKFTWGKEDLTGGSPVKLKEYLADLPNGRFAAEAQGLVTAFYARAEEQLQNAVGTAKDRNLVRALLGLVTLVSSRIDPTVTVGFKANAEILAQGRAAGVVIDPLPAFAPAVQRRRERLIVDLLSDAVSKVVSANVLVLAEAPAGAKPDILVTYTVRPIPGGLRRYVNNDVYQGNLQDFSISWVIDFAGPRQYAYRAQSQAVSSINSQGYPTDPVWTPYAVTQYSAFFDMTLGLMEAAGLPAAPRPTVFDTRDVL